MADNLCLAVKLPHLTFIGDKGSPGKCSYPSKVYLYFLFNKGCLSANTVTGYIDIYIQCYSIGNYRVLLNDNRSVVGFSFRRLTMYYN